MQRDPHALQIEVDGSRQGDRRGGYAGHAIYPDTGLREELLFNNFVETTIPRMELAAVIAAIEWATENKPPGVARLQILTDALHTVVENVPRAPYWQGNDWRNSYGKPVSNPTYGKKFLSVRAKASKAGLRIDVGWERGKQTKEAMLVDQRAKAAAKSATRPDRGNKVGKLGRAVNKGSARMYPANGDTIVIRECGSKLAGKHKENLVTFEIYNESTGAIEKKFFAYAQPQIGADLHRQRYFRVRMNDNPQYPQILEVLEELPLTKGKRAASVAQGGDLAAAMS
jgi:ribonuclease HI